MGDVEDTPTDKKKKGKKGKKEEEPTDGRPLGLNPLFITNTTQKMFDIVIGEHLTPEAPYKFLSKEKVLADLQFRGVTADWAEIKGPLRHKNTPDEILVWSDYEETYGENFYVVTNQGTIDQLMKEWEEKNAKPEEPEEGAEGEQEEEEAKPQRPAEWISLGSDIELKELQVEKTRELLAMNLSRKRKEFGIPIQFGDREASENFQEYRPFKDPNFELKTTEVETATQAIPDKLDISTQTTWNRLKNFSEQYRPLEMSDDEKEDMVDSNEFLEFLDIVKPRYEEALEMNECVDIYMDDFADIAEEDVTFGNKADSVLRPLHSFTDIVYSKSKCITAMDWHHTQKGVIAVTCAERMTYDERVEESHRVRSSYVLVWNFIDPIHPQFVLEAPSDVMTLRFHPKRKEIIVGGCYNGQIAMWDLTEAMDRVGNARKKNSDEDTKTGDIVVKAQLVSVLETSHQHIATDLAWLKGVELNKSGQMVAKDLTHQFVTIGFDGQVLVWDIRNEDPKKRRRAPTSKRKEGEDDKKEEKNDNPWVPVFRGELQFGGRMSGALQICLPVVLEPEGEDAVKFFASTDEGNLLWCDFGGKGGQDEAEEEQTQSSGNNIARKLAPGHTMPAVSLQRSPHFPEILLTVGDRTFNLWTEDLTTPIFTSPSASAYLTCGRWSISRPGIIFVGRVDGAVEIWDLTDQSHKCSISSNVTTHSITNMELYGDYVAIGDHNGNCHIMEIPRTLRRPIANEKQIMKSFYEREVKRVAYVAMRQEVRKGEKETMERERVEKEKADKEDNEEALLDEAAKLEEKAEAEFRKMEEEFKKKMGIGGDGAAPAADQPVPAPVAEEPAEAAPEGAKEEEGSEGEEEGEEGER